MKKTSALFLAAVLIGSIVGCSSEKPVAESTESKTQSNEAAGSWSPEATAAFKKANERAKSGADNGSSDATSKGK